MDLVKRFGHSKQKSLQFINVGSNTGFMQGLQADAQESNSSLSALDLGFGVLTHKFEIVCQQLDDGQVLLDRVTTFFKKLSAIEEQYCKALMKLALSEQEELVCDRMTDFTNTWRTMTNLASVMAKSHENFQQKIINEILQPLQTCSKEGSAMKKEILQNQKKCKANLANNYDTVIKSKKICLKEWSTLSQLNAELDGSLLQAMSDPNEKSRLKAAGKVVKEEKKVEKQLILAKNLFEKHQDILDQYNDNLNSYHHEEMPSSLVELQHLEKSRLTTMAGCLAKWAIYQREAVEPVPPLCKSFKEKCETIDSSQSISQCINGWLNEHNFPKNHEPLSFDLPCPIRAINQVIADPASSPWKKYLDKPGKEKDRNDKDVLYVDAWVYRVKKSHQPQFDSDLDLVAGDQVLVMSNTVSKTKDYMPEGPAWYGERLGAHQFGTFPASCVEKVPVDNNISLNHFLLLPEGRNRFHEFLQKEYSAENLEFWEEARKFRTIHAPVFFHFRCESG
mmetsp:Transcript_37232/g.73149  ORF Transcript_37232/g.73149 Transcript_37232/m.73149 type:complete len:506 (-) Transcript_37232:1040-2557(-)